jgi:hypothetical protein
MPAALLLFLCIACNNKANYKAPVNDNAIKAEEPLARGAVSLDSTAIAGNGEFEQTVPGQGQTKQKNNTPSAAPAANPDWDKKIIKTADLHIEAKNFKIFTDRLHRAVKQSGGYIAGEQQTQSLSTIENTVTIKVPVDQFEDLLLEVASDSDRLVGKKISSEDVTTQLVDTRSRLETKKEVRERYLELLKQAKGMKDILAVQDVINNLQEEMDAAAGRIAYLGHSAAFSTVNLTFYQVLDATVKDDLSPSFWHKVKDAVDGGWTWASSLVLGLISIWPLLLLGGLGWMAVRRRLQPVQRKTKPSIDKA